MPTQIENRKARHDYFLHEKFEAGIVLQGHEVKSIREGRVNLADSFVRIMKNEAFLFNCHISTYSKIQGHMEIMEARSRKLLLKRTEINSLAGKLSQKGYALIPTRMYFKKGLVKVEIALAKGKKEWDKRETIKKRIHDRETNTAIKDQMRKKR